MSIATNNPNTPANAVITHRIDVYGSLNDLQIQKLQDINTSYGTEFILMCFRKPRKNADGCWNHPYQLPTLLTLHGETEREHGYPIRRMFDLRYVRAQVQLGRRSPYAVLNINALQNTQPHNPKDVRIVHQVDWVLALADVQQAHLLIADGEDFAMPYLYALVERRSQLVVPVPIRCAIIIRVGTVDELGQPDWAECTASPLSEPPKSQMMEITVQKPNPHPAPKPTQYDHYFDVPATISDNDVLQRLAKDSALLRRELLARNSDRFAVVREGLTILRADNPAHPQDKRTLEPESGLSSKEE